jgi:hypothetical protein
LVDVGNEPAEHGLQGGCRRLKLVAIRRLPDIDEALELEHIKPAAHLDARVPLCAKSATDAPSGGTGITGAVLLDAVTQLLRRGDPSLVEADLVDLLVSGEEEWLNDDRDLMMALARITIARSGWVLTCLRSSPARQRLVQPASVSWSRSSVGAPT